MNNNAHHCPICEKNSEALGEWMGGQGSALGRSLPTAVSLPNRLHDSVGISNAARMYVPENTRRESRAGALLRVVGCVSFRSLHTCQRQSVGRMIIIIITLPRQSVGSTRLL